jgi:hypothetical protein
METISLASVVVASKDQISTDLEDEVVVLHLSDGVFFRLNGSGARIWNLLQVPLSVGAIRDTLIEDYEVEPNRCEQDLLKLLQKLHSKGLIDIK